MSIDFEKIRANFAEVMLLNVDVLEITVSENLLRVLVKDDANPDELPATFLDESGHHIGISYDTPSRIKAREAHKAIEEAALAADTNPNKSAQQKVTEFLAAQSNS